MRPVPTMRSSSPSSTSLPHQRGAAAGGRRRAPAGFMATLVLLATAAIPGLPELLAPLGPLGTLGPVAALGTLGTLEALGTCALVAGAAATPAFAERHPVLPDPLAPGLSGADRLKALLDRVKLTQKEVRTIEARFVQHRVSAMLVAPEDSTGTFSYAAPDRVRWEYQAPTPITVVITGTEMTTWYRDLKRAEKLKIGRYSNQVFKFLGASGSMDTLLEYFTVELTLPKEKGDPYRLKLLPKYERIKKRIRSMRVDIDSERFFPNHLEYQEADGDVTSYDFKDFQWNPPLPASRFALQLPPGVETRVVDMAKDAKPQGRP